MMKILIPYASAHGSTAEVAQFMGTELTRQGFSVTVSSIQLLNDVAGYDAFLLGSAVHSGVWLPEMVHFVREYRTQMATKPVYLWVMCIRVLEPGGHEHVLEHYFPKHVVEQLPIYGVRAFAGKIDQASLDWSESWTMALRYDGMRTAKSYSGDFRDWDDIRSWTQKVGSELQSLSTRR